MWVRMCMYKFKSPRQKYWADVQGGQSYPMVRRCLFGLLSHPSSDAPKIKIPYWVDVSLN